MSDLLSEIAKEVMIKEIVPELARFIGERAARGVAFKIISDSTERAMKYLNVKLPEDLCEIFRYTYEQLDGGEVECEEKDGKMIIRVKRCPLVERFGMDENICVVAAAMKRGIIRATLGKDAMVVTKNHKYGSPTAQVIINKKKTLVEGDDECLFEVEVKG